MAATVQLPIQVYKDAPMTSRRLPAYHDAGLPEDGFGAIYSPGEDITKYSTPTPDNGTAAHELTHGFLSGAQKQARGAAALSVKMRENPDLYDTWVVHPTDTARMEKARKFGRIRSTARKLRQSVKQVPYELAQQMSAVDEGTAYAIGKQYGFVPPAGIEKGPELEQSVLKTLPPDHIAHVKPIGDVNLVEYSNNSGYSDGGKPVFVVVPGYNASGADIGRQMRGAEDLISQLGIDGTRFFVRGKMREGYQRGKAPSLPQEAQTLREDRVAFFDWMGGR